MGYVDVGQGDSIVFLHGDVTSSYLWRNVMPHVEPLGRCVAIDLIGVGDCNKGPGSYSFANTHPIWNRCWISSTLETGSCSSGTTGDATWPSSGP